MLNPLALLLFQQPARGDTCVSFGAQRNGSYIASRFYIVPAR